MNGIIVLMPTLWCWSCMDMEIFVRKEFLKTCGEHGGVLPVLPVCQLL